MPNVGHLVHDEYLKASFTERALAHARSLVGVREQPSNRGTWVERFLRAVGLGPGYAWCAAFVYYCFTKAGTPLERLPKARKAAAVREWLSWAQSKGYAYRQLSSHSVRIKRGDLMLYPRGSSHIGIVCSVQENVDGLFIRTIEGNTNASGSREGDGVYDKYRRVDPSMWFIDMRAATA